MSYDPPACAYCPGTVRACLPEPTPEARAEFARRLAQWAVRCAVDEVLGEALATREKPLGDGDLTISEGRGPLGGEVERTPPPTAPTADGD